MESKPLVIAHRGVHMAAPSRQAAGPAGRTGSPIEGAQGAIGQTGSPIEGARGAAGQTGTPIEGARGATENTMEAFELALAAGADMIELDVRRTGDGQLAILHDHAHAGVALDSCTLDEFAERTGMRPPLLEEVLAWASGRIALDVELKEDGYAEQVALPLQAFAAAGGELLITSFIDALLARISVQAPDLPLGLLLEFTAMRAAERARAAGAGAVLPAMKLVDERLIAELTEARLELVVWDFMASEHRALLSDRRVAGVITDDVPGALAARAALRI